MDNCNCDLMYVVLSALWIIVAAAIAGPICIVIGRRNHPVERSARRETKRYRDTKRYTTEFVYRGPGGGRN